MWRERGRGTRKKLPKGLTRTWKGGGEGGTWKRFGWGISGPRTGGPSGGGWEGTMRACGGVGWVVLEIPGTEQGKGFTKFELRGVDWNTTTLLFSLSVSGADLAILQGGGSFDILDRGVFLKTWDGSDRTLQTGLLALITTISGSTGT